MEMRTIRHQVDVQEWQKRILARNASGLSVRRWCADNQIQESRYYYWLHVLRSEELTAIQKPANMFAEIRLQDSKQEHNNHMSAGICAVIRGPGLCLEIYNGADAVTLEVTMRTLGVGSR